MIDTLNEVWVDGELLEPHKMRDEYHSYYYPYQYGGNIYSHLGNGYGCFTWNIPDKLVLDTTPCKDIKNGIYIKYHSFVTEEACQLDKMLYERYREGIQRRAIEIILSIPGYEWTRPDFAIDSARRARTEIDNAKIDVMRGYALGQNSIIKNRQW